MIGNLKKLKELEEFLWQFVYCGVELAPVDEIIKRLNEVKSEIDSFQYQHLQFKKGDAKNEK